MVPDKSRNTKSGAISPTAGATSAKWDSASPGSVGNSNEHPLSPDENSQIMHIPMTARALQLMYSDRDNLDHPGLNKKPDIETTS